MNKYATRVLPVDEYPTADGRARTVRVGGAPGRGTQEFGLAEDGRGRRAHDRTRRRLATVRRRSGRARAGRHLDRYVARLGNCSHPHGAGWIRVRRGSSAVTLHPLYRHRRHLLRGHLTTPAPDTDSPDSRSTVSRLVDVRPPVYAVPDQLAGRARSLSTTSEL